MSTVEGIGRPATELSDQELEQQGKHAHEMRNWVFLHGTAEQFATHTARMLELEREYLLRYPKRTWQGSGGAPDRDSDIAVLRSALRGVIAQLESLLEQPRPAGLKEAEPVEDPVIALLRRVAEAPGGRMHKLEVHQAAREVGLERAALAKLYTGEPKLLATENEERVITEAGRARLTSA